MLPGLLLLVKIKITLKSFIIRVASSLLSLSTTKLDAETDVNGLSFLSLSLSLISLVIIFNSVFLIVLCGS